MYGIKLRISSLRREITRRSYKWLFDCLLDNRDVFFGEEESFDHL